MPDRLSDPLSYPASSPPPDLRSPRPAGTRVPGLLGGRVLLRAPRPEDADALYEITRDAATMMMLMSSRAWIPDSPDGFLARHVARLREPADAADAWFVVADRDDTVVYGQADLWGIDSHNRYGNIGLSLTPRWRGRGLGRDIVEVLCRYAFTIRGLHRLQYEASTPNRASVRTAERAGLRREALLRSYEWTYGELSDSVVFARLAHEWRDPGPGHGSLNDPVSVGGSGDGPAPAAGAEISAVPAAGADASAVPAAGAEAGPADRPVVPDPAVMLADGLAPPPPDGPADDPDPLVGRSVRLRAV
ncbi:MAG: GNAT family N-acetyltransferase, partial [Frankia sp.]